MKCKWIILINILHIHFLDVQSDPYGCVWDALTLKYECNYRNIALPLSLSSFDQTPENIDVIEIDGAFPASAPNGPTFSGFSAIATAKHLDKNNVPKLTMRCIASGSILLESGSFTGMEYIKRVAFENCQIIAIPDFVFSGFVELDSLEFIGGTIGDIGFDAFSGLNISPGNVANPGGTLAFRYSKLSAGILPSGFFYPLTNLTHLILDNIGLSQTDVNMLLMAKQLKYLSLNDNLFTSLASGFLNDVSSLSELRLNGIKWDCSCTNLWIATYCRSNNITLHSDLVCETPASYKNKRGHLYEKEQCTSPKEVCLGKKGIDTGGSWCMTYKFLGTVSSAMVPFIISLVTISLICHERKHIKAEEDRKKSLFENRSLSVASLGNSSSSSIDMSARI